MSGAAAERPRSTHVPKYAIRFPSGNIAADQDEEWCEVQLPGGPRRLRFHDYADIYDQPGLYEQLFYHELRCTSPPTVAGLLAEALEADGTAPEDLRVLDVGAGNGMVAEQLREDLGIQDHLGVDIIPSAAKAAERDRPGLYEDYLVADLTALTPEQELRIAEFKPNGMTVVAALGFGDIPPVAYVNAYNALDDDGWIAYCIKEDFISDGDKSGFERLIDRALAEGAMEEVARQRYRHRFSAARRPLHYVAMIARKRQPIPLDWAERVTEE